MLLPVTECSNTIECNAKGVGTIQCEHYIYADKCGIKWYEPDILLLLLD